MRSMLDTLPAVAGRPLRGPLRSAAGAGGEGGAHQRRPAPDGKTEQNPGGTPIEVFDGFRKALAANRAQFYLDVASGPFYGFNRDGAEVSQGTIQNWWRQGMIGSAKAHYEGIKAFSETDQTEDLKSITLPVLVMQGDDDQVVPYKNAAILQDQLLPNSQLIIYPGFPHGMHTSHADTINADLLAFIRA